jgi:hypothetical protein
MQLAINILQQVMPDANPIVIKRGINPLINPTNPPPILSKISRLVGIGQKDNQIIRMY